MTQTHDVDDWDAHWSHKGGSARWNPAQRWRRNLINGHLSGFPNVKRVVDVGCGQGELLASLGADMKPGVSLFGVDGSAEGVQNARLTAPSAEVVVGDLLTGAGIPHAWLGTMDVAICSEVLEHVDEPVRVLEWAGKLTRSGGFLIVTVPGGPRTAYDRHIGHRAHFSPTRMAQISNTARLEVVSCVGAGFPFFNIYKFGILAAGHRLVNDVGTGQGLDSSGERISRFVFRLLMMSSRRGTLGWQTVAILRKP